MFAGASNSHAPDQALLFQYQLAGQQMHALAEPISLSKAFAPVNRGAEQLKYLAGKNPQAPQFIYPPAAVDPARLERDLNAIPVLKTHAELSELYERKKEQLCLQAQLLKHCGDRQRMADLSKRLYGAPSQDVLQAAQAIIAAPNQAPAPEARPRDRDFLRKAYEAALQQAGLNDWRAELGTAPQSYVNSANRCVYVGGMARYSDTDVRRLVTHEVTVHVYRGANGYAQHPAIALPMATGLWGYDVTEEGLAVSAEKLNGFLKHEMLLRYSSRVLAVQSVHDGADFNGTYQMLLQHGYSPHAAFTGTLRAHRGGGFCKDHVYLEGYLQLQRFMALGGDLKDLYAGKFAVQELGLIGRLKAQGFVQAPRLLPSWL